MYNADEMDQPIAHEKSKLIEETDKTPPILLKSQVITNISLPKIKVPGLVVSVVKFYQIFKRNITNLYSVFWENRSR